MLDLAGNGVATQSIAAGVTFDLNATGQAVNTGWITSGEGFLVLDRNGDGVINNGSELFGSSTRLTNGDRAANGFAALSELDSNGDGLITSLDADWSRLKVWVDTDPNAGAGTLYGLNALNIAALNLSYTTSGAIDQGNVIGQVSSYLSVDGTRHEMSDVWFAQSPNANATPGATLSVSSLTANVGGLVQAIGNFNTAPGTTVNTGATAHTALNGVTTPSTVGGMVAALTQYNSSQAVPGLTNTAVATQPLNLTPLPQADQSTPLIKPA